MDQVFHLSIGGRVSKCLTFSRLSRRISKNEKSLFPFVETREFPLFLFRLKNREKGRRTRGREKQNYQAFKAWKRERKSSAPLLGSDHLAGRQIPARLTFSSKNEEKKKKKKKRQRYFARPGFSLSNKALSLRVPLILI